MKIYFMCLLFTACSSAPQPPKPVPVKVAAADMTSDASSPADDGGPHFVGDPCGRQPGFDYAPSCGNFCVASDGLMIRQDQCGMPNTFNVSCGACPGGAQCGATVFDADYGNHQPYSAPNWCIMPCTLSQCGQVIDAVSPKGQSWGPKMQCPPC